MRTIALVVAIALGVAAAIGVRAYLQSAQRQIESEQRLVSVAATRQAMEAGEELVRGLVTEKRIPAISLTPDQITLEEVNRYYGREVQTDIGQDIVLRAEHFVSREPRKASTELPEAHRAVTISVDQTSGVAGLIRPGNRVDIFSTGVGEAGGRGGQETWRVLSDVTVLAVDSRMSDMDGFGMAHDRQRHRYSNLTLAVTPAEAQLLIYLTNNARLTFALRPEREVGEPEAIESVDGGNVRRLSEEANRQRQRLLQEAADQ